MKYLLLILLPLSLVGCTILHTQHGADQFWGDYTNVQFDDGSVHFSADTMIHSNAIRAHWHGANNLTASVVAGAIGLKGGNQAIGALGTIIPPVVNRPTNRATPKPKP